MIPINNSDTAWLITADYNQDNDISFPEELRKDVRDVDVNQWTYEYRGSRIGGFPYNCVGDDYGYAGGAYYIGVGDRTYGIGGYVDEGSGGVVGGNHDTY